MIPPGGAQPVEVLRESSVEGPSTIETAKEEVGVIYTCKFPGCTRQYASTDGVRKHCRKSHSEWLKEVDLEKASLGCRWAAYCTRHVIEEGGEDVRNTPVGCKRAREIIAEGNAQYNGVFQAEAVAPPAAARPSSSAVERRERDAPAGPDRAFGGVHGRGLVPPQPSRTSSCENAVPPEMVSVPNDLSTPLPAQESKLTPNAQARQRLGEIADSETMAASVASQNGGSSFFAWGMPPLKRGLSLADTREAAAGTATPSIAEGPEEAESVLPPSRNESFLDSILAEAAS
eukprot:CAMPEP_0115853402 /NCGR_PEP_ID=MMETSP0287-20121206/13485_1 /TAXON_ID=412157 /ORGANISM="Chrysochromulina rotalis, Strain UIO044" /LENGTH=287 /DNA_ID=CAMNT_0003307477 /DNA_START=105 /DNA_END=968 /DNA_ORIENTATION=+